ncbi:hypothetical protein [Paenibacillus sp. KN14-4R]|uniref:hypothetical protein n=1 Tax=Paenibacillus sp. KN14-4R TaxID=3445773 RepID=UPI003F9F5451
MKSFFTAENTKWIIGICIPAVITVIGWISVYRLNQRNMRRDKRITTYLNTFQFIKDPINDLIQSFSELSSFMFNCYTKLEQLETSNILFEIDMKLLVEDYNKKTFEELQNKLHKSFIKFIYSWEQYEIVLLTLVKQRHVLQEEFMIVSSEMVTVISEYNRYFLFMSKNINMSVDERIKLAVSISTLFENVLDLGACVRDVNVNLQNFIFYDLLETKIDKRNVTEPDKYLTIDTLLKKYEL